MSTQSDIVSLRHGGRYPALVLNSDYRPLSLFPLGVYRWKDAIKAVFLDRVDIVAEHEAVVRSPSIAMRIPSIIVLRCYVRHRRWPAFTKENVKLRDRYACGYCGHKFRSSDLTWDHVIPRSKGGPTRWENVLSACEPCNRRKSDHLCQDVGMTPLWRAWRPTPEELHKASVAVKRFPVAMVPPSWAPYVGELEAA